MAEKFRLRSNDWDIPLRNLGSKPLYLVQLRLLEDLSLRPRTDPCWKCTSEEKQEDWGTSRELAGKMMAAAGESGSTLAGNRLVSAAAIEQTGDLLATATAELWSRLEWTKRRHLLYYNDHV